MSRNQDPFKHCSTEFMISLKTSLHSLHYNIPKYFRNSSANGKDHQIVLYKIFI